MTPEQIQQFASQCKHTVHAHGLVAFPDLSEFASLVEQHVRDDERAACLACYSPDDTATDWADKINARSKP